MNDESPETNEPKRVRDVGALREFMKSIEDVSDDTRLYYFDGHTVYDLEAEVGVRMCREDNGKRWPAAGLVFEIDG